MSRESNNLLPIWEGNTIGGNANNLGFNSYILNLLAQGNHDIPSYGASTTYNRTGMFSPGPVLNMPTKDQNRILPEPLTTGSNPPINMHVPTIGRSYIWNDIMRVLRDR